MTRTAPRAVPEPRPVAMTRQLARPAATLILLRDAAQGPELFMVERSHAADFVAGAYVFPGGAVDAADAHPDVLARVQGLSDTAASRRLGVPSEGIGYWVAAVRECFPAATLMVPGIRPAAGDVGNDDQSRVATPAAALRVMQVQRCQRNGVSETGPTRAHNRPSPSRRNSGSGPLPGFRVHRPTQSRR